MRVNYRQWLTVDNAKWQCGFIGARMFTREIDYGMAGISHNAIHGTW